MGAAVAAATPSKVGEVAAVTPTTPDEKAAVRVNPYLAALALALALVVATGLTATCAGGILAPRPGRDGSARPG